MKQDLTSSRAPASEVRAPGRALSLNLGIGSRLALAFAAVLILAVGANLASRRAQQVTQTAQVHVVQHREPAIDIAANLAPAVAGYERSVVAVLDTGTEAAAIDADRAAAQLHTAAKQLIGAGAAHQALEPMRRAVSRYELRGRELIRLAQQRQQSMQQYWDLLQALETRITEPLDKAWKIIGRIFARQSLVDLDRDLDAIRQRAGDAIAVNRRDEARAQALVEAETQFQTTLDRNAGKLCKTQGAQWCEALRAEYAQLLGVRQMLFQQREALDASKKAFQSQSAALATAIGKSITSPTVQPTRTETVTTTTRPTEDRNDLIAWLSGAVLLVVLLISLATFASVALPVRRLTRATYRLASGETQTRVPRGGVRELDLLAVSFNQMAERLGIAEAAVRGYQAQLEAKVDERTRQLQHLAEHDPLTGLPNRRHLFSSLETAIERAAMNGRRMGLLFVDLDNFKTINDGLGHDFGDRVLMRIGERLRMTEASSGLRARLGGDEFTVICEDASSIADVAERAAAFVAAFHQPLSVDGRELMVSVSIGASVFPDHATDANELLRAADAALFKAKDLGRNQLCMFTADLLENATSRFRLEQALRRAVDQGEFELVFQPEVCFETLEVTCVEALLRWRQADGTYRAPGEFLAVAEHTGLITEISEFVVRNAIATAAHWYRGEWPGVKVAINVSARELLSEPLLAQISALLHEYNLPPQCIEIELTENVLQTGPATIDALHRLRALGVSIALDDFGTGYSSLTSLEQLPLTRVKLDRSLIDSVDTSARSATIVRSIIGLCNGLGLDVTAEGVERPTQLSMLLHYRGLSLQGFLLARPLSVMQVNEFLPQVREQLQQLLIAAPETALPVDATGTRYVRHLRSVFSRQSSGGS